jgi:transcription-repair coupling factor (superfamily II helicase)
LTSVEAASQRLPPGSALADSTFRLQPGDELNLPAFEDYLARAGYAIVEEVENPGEAALRGEVIDLYPPAAEYPSRLAHSDGRIEDIRRYDPVSQRTIGDAGALLLDPASEILLEPGQPRSAGMEQRLPRFYPRLESIFDYLPEALLATDPDVAERAAAWTDQIADAHRYRQIVGRTGAAEPPIPPEALYLSEADWRDLLESRQRPDLGARDGEAGPNFTDAADPADAARRYLWRCHNSGDRIVLTAATPRQLRRLARIAPLPAKSINSWEDSEGIEVAALIAPLEAGFRYDGAVALTAADLWGPESDRGRASSQRLLPETELGLGDIVIHPEHGIGRLEGLETVESGESPEDFVRLAYAGPTAVLAPIDEIDGIRRYGSADAAVTLDRPDGERWRQRRAEIEAELAHAAEGLVALAAARKQRRAAVLDPPRRAYNRFVDRFPYAETPDQSRAISAVLNDLRSGRPMDRLVCGEVGFGKTEVALRAVAAAVLSGKQAAVLAPTTVLARQHFETFRRRFAPFGIEIVQLSRFVSASEAKAAKQALRRGTAKIAVGTHALLSKTVRFAELGLLVIDEEQRFASGTRRRCGKWGAISTC